MKKETNLLPLMEASLRAMEVPMKAGITLQQQLLNTMPDRTPVVKQALEWNHRMGDQLEAQVLRCRELLAIWADDARDTLEANEKVMNQMAELSRATGPEALAQGLEDLQKLLMDGTRARMESALELSRKMAEGATPLTPEAEKPKPKKKNTATRAAAS